MTRNPPSAARSSWRGRVEFRHPYIRKSVELIPPRTHPQGTSFLIQPGERIAIVGPTGSGKTSLIGCSARFYDVFATAVIFLDCIDIMIEAVRIRKRIGVVLRTSIIFAGSSYDISPCDPTINVTRAGSARRCWCRRPPSFGRCPQLHTRLTERGRNLDHGQRASVSLSHACSP